jgi:hypothetical protein
VTAARLAARCVELLDGVGGPIAVSAPPDVSPRSRRACRSRTTAPSRAPCACCSARASTSGAGGRLGRAGGPLASGAPVVVVDHNQPRTLARRALGVLALAARGLPPERARHPVAREVNAHGFTIERLRLEDGERVQLVLARRR